MYLYSAPLMHYHFLYISADLHKPVRQPGISEHCETTDTGWCINTIRLFTTPTLAGYSFQSNHRGQAQAE